MTNPTQPAPTPDEHLATLTALAEHYEQAAAHFARMGCVTDRGIPVLHRKRAAAIRWLLEQNAYGVHESEVTL